MDQDGFTNDRVDDDETASADAGDDAVDELLIEEISIDGMCGVY